MKKIYITGVSGTGKTTIAQELQKRGYYAISIDEVDGLCSWINPLTGENDGAQKVELTLEFVDKHDWICDVTYLQKLLDKDVDAAFVLGMATNQNQFLHLFDKILLLECRPETFCKRIEERTDNEFGKDKKVQEQILGRYESYAREMRAKGSISIDTDRPVEVVVEDVISKAIA
ncbi:MAG TPA: AAA family ATPase [Candidatus Paceibacterota bacterium]|nr:AAA family ATPase [Candidatus Paceibacterota bacterium]